MSAQRHPSAVRREANLNFWNTSLIVVSPLILLGAVIALNTLITGEAPQFNFGN